MKVVFKNTKLVFEKTFLSKTVTIQGKMTASEKGGTSVMVNGLNPNSFYKVTLPESMWNITQYSSSYIFLIQGYLDNVERTRNVLAGTDNLFAYTNIRTFYVTGVDSLGLFARADLGTDVNISIKEVHLTLNKVHTFNFNVTQGTGVYDITGFTPEKNKYYHAVISDITKVTSIQYAYNNPSSPTTRLWVELQEPSYVICNSDEAPYEKAQIGAGNVIGSGSVSVDIYEAVEDA